MHVIEPIKPLPNFSYRCDSRFHLDAIQEMFEERQKYGFILIDGNGTMLATLQGTSRETLFRYQASLPKKHHKGGQSAQRFARLRLEARGNYVTKMNEVVTQNFIDRQTNKPNVAGLFLAGNADFKHELRKLLDPRLGAVVVGVFDIQYSGNQGFNEAIEQAAPILQHLPLLQEKKILSGFFGEIAKDSGLYCFGLTQVISALEQGAVETLLLWENHPTQRFVVTTAGSEAVSIRFGARLELGEGESMLESLPLVDWLAEHFQQFGCRLEIVTDSSPEGHQFCQGFGGLGALLRYQIQMPEEIFNDEEDASDSDDFWD